MANLKMLELEGEIIHHESTIRALREVIHTARTNLCEARSKLADVKKSEQCQTLYRAVVNTIIVLDKENDIG